MTADGPGAAPDRGTVFARLLGEGIDVWRPVPAVILGNGRYELFATEEDDPECERWEFAPGTVVMGEAHFDGTIRVRQSFESRVLATDLEDR